MGVASYSCRQQSLKAIAGGLESCKSRMRVQHLKYIPLVSSDSNFFTVWHCLLMCTGPLRVGGGGGGSREYFPGGPQTCFEKGGPTRVLNSQARRQGGFEGVRANPPFCAPKDFIYTSKLHILSILPFESGPLVSLLLRITTASLVAATAPGYASSFMGDQRGTRA